MNTNFPNLKEIIESINMSWQTASTLLLISLSILIGNEYDVAYVRDIPLWGISLAVVVGIGSFWIIFVRLLSLLIDGSKLIISWFKKAKRKRDIEELILNLAPEEIWVLAYFTTLNRQAFTATYDCITLILLITKGIVIKEGGHNQILA